MCPIIRKVKTAPSPVVSMYCNSEIVHITLDSGAEAPLIVPEECKRLGIKINPPSQLANGIDKSKLEVLGEIRTIFERGPLKLSFEALVIPKIDGATILAGSPFQRDGPINEIACWVPVSLCRLGLCK